MILRRHFIHPTMTCNFTRPRDHKPHNVTISELLSAAFVLCCFRTAACLQVHTACCNDQSSPQLTASPRCLVRSRCAYFVHGPGPHLGVGSVQICGFTDQSQSHKAQFWHRMPPAHLHSFSQLVDQILIRLPLASGPDRADLHASCHPWCALTSGADLNDAVLPVTLEIHPA